jgi:hypothetical protein
MNRTQLYTVVLASIVGGVIAGWISNELLGSPRISVVDHWRSHLQLLVNGDGRIKEEADIALSAKLALQGASWTLATHYDSLSAEDKRAVESRLETALALPDPPEFDIGRRALECIKAAQSKGISDDCLRTLSRDHATSDQI